MCEEMGFPFSFSRVFPSVCPLSSHLSVRNIHLGDVTSTLTWHICVTTTKNDFFGPPLCLSMYTYMWRLGWWVRIFRFWGVPRRSCIHITYTYTYMLGSFRPDPCAKCVTYRSVRYPLLTFVRSLLLYPTDDGDGEPPCIVSLR